jgi:site-specific recombinase XerD
MVNEERVAFAEMAADLERDYEINKKRSLRSARLSISHLTNFFRYHRAPDITTDRVREYVSRRQAEGAANASVNRELSALKRMFSLYIQAGKLTAKPHIPMLEENNARQGFLDHGDFLKLKAKLPAYLQESRNVSLLLGLACVGNEGVGMAGRGYGRQSGEAETGAFQEQEGTVVAPSR